MGRYRIEFARSARKEFEKLPERIRDRIVDALELLSVNPHSEFLKVKKMRGGEDLFRLRFGHYLLVYEVRDHVLVVLVIKIGHRREVYKRF